MFDNEHSTSSFYGRRPTTTENQLSPVVSPQHQCWQPGQRLPIATSPPRLMSQPPQYSYSAEGHHTRNLRMVESMVQSLQGTINTGFANVKGRLDRIEDRVAKIEESNELLQTSHSESPLPPPAATTEKGRKRRSPPELQVALCRLFMHYVILLLLL